jgi:Predicted transcriptional regulators
MKINEVIRKYRKEENLTQEQLANYLGVSAPAVNKWENGISYPDITLLSPLARILKIDVDTLLSFHEELSDTECRKLVREISESIPNEGFAAGFEKGEALLKEYPDCDILRLYTADMLRLHLTVKKIENPEIYENKINGWYEIALSSKDEKIVSMAKLSLVGSHMCKGDYQEAQQLLDKVQPVVFDKRFTQVVLYEKQARYEDAYEVLETMLYENGQNICHVLQMLCNLLWKETKYTEADQYADLNRDIALLLNLGEYDAYSPNFFLATEKKDKKQSIETLEHMINGIETYEEYKASKLYTHVKFYKSTNTNYKKTLKNVLKNNKKLDFIRNEPDAKRLFKKLEE